MTLYRYVDPEHTTIERTSDGAFIPAAPGNRDFDDIVRTGAEVAPYQRFATLDAAKAGRFQELAHRRWLAEQDFSFGGMSLALDDGTQRRIAGAIQYMQLSGETSVRWQVARGVFTSFSAAQMTALGVAVGDHIQACFANVEVISALILACGEIADVEAVDIEQGWP